jgi:hypothetical protein
MNYGWTTARHKNVKWKGKARNRKGKNIERHWATLAWLKSAKMHIFLRQDSHWATAYNQQASRPLRLFLAAFFHLAAHKHFYFCLFFPHFSVPSLSMQCHFCVHIDWWANVCLPPTSRLGASRHANSSWPKCLHRVVGRVASLGNKPWPRRKYFLLNIFFARYASIQLSNAILLLESIFAFTSKIASKSQLKSSATFQFQYWNCSFGYISSERK